MCHVQAHVELLAVWVNPKLGGWFRGAGHWFDVGAMSCAENELLNKLPWQPERGEKVGGQLGAAVSSSLSRALYQPWPDLVPYPARDS